MTLCKQFVRGVGGAESPGKCSGGLASSQTGYPLYSACTILVYFLHFVHITNTHTQTHTNTHRSRGVYSRRVATPKSASFTSPAWMYDYTTHPVQRHQTSTEHWTKDHTKVRFEQIGDLQLFCSNTCLYKTQFWNIVPTRKGPKRPQMSKMVVPQRTQSRGCSGETVPSARTSFQTTLRCSHVAGPRLKSPG